MEIFGIKSNPDSGTVKQIGDEANVRENKLKFNSVDSGSQQGSQGCRAKTSVKI